MCMCATLASRWQDGGRHIRRHVIYSLGRPHAGQCARQIRQVPAGLGSRAHEDAALASVRPDSAESVPASIDACSVSLHGPSVASNEKAVRRLSQCGLTEASWQCEPANADRALAVASRCHSRVVCRDITQPPSILRPPDIFSMIHQTCPAISTAVWAS